MKILITCITPVLQVILDFFPDIISFQHVFHLGVGRSQIEWKLKVKTQISVFPWAKIGQNDHSNPYIESTTVLSDTTILCPSPNCGPWHVWPEVVPPSAALSLVTNVPLEGRILQASCLLYKPAGEPRSCCLRGRTDGYCIKLLAHV